MIKIKRKDSTDWIPEATELKKLPKPLGEIYKNQNKVKTAASYVLKFFLEKEVKFGHGENFMWDFEVPVDRLKYSSQGALNSWKKSKVKNQFPQGDFWQVIKLQIYLISIVHIEYPKLLDM